MLKLVCNNSGQAKFRLFDLTVTDLTKLAQNESDKVVKFVQLFD